MKRKKMSEKDENPTPGPIDEKDENPTVEVASQGPIDETVEDIQKAIAELNSKLSQKVDTEDEKEVALLELPLASVHVSQVKGRGQTVWKHNVTPPEAQVLVAMFHAAAGELPIFELKLNSAHKAEKELEAKKHEDRLKEYAEAKAKQGVGAGEEGTLTIDRKAEEEHPVTQHRYLYAKKKAAAIQTTLKVDPRRYKAYLQGKYQSNLVEKLFPGSEPGEAMPKTFKRALGAGLTNQPEKSPYAQGNEARLFDMSLESPN